MAESYCTVLLIDGSTTDRAFFRRCLEQDEIYSYEILEAELPEAGLEWGRQPLPDVILLDAGLPRDVLQLLSQLNHLSWSQIVLLVEQDDRTLVTQAMQHGAADYLVKPDLSADLLRRTVRSLVKQSRLQQQLAHQQATIADLTGRTAKSSEQHYLSQSIPPESEARFRELTEYLRDAFFICTPTLDQYLYISPAVERIWGIASERLYRDPRCWLELVHPDDWDYFQTHTPLNELNSDYDLEYRILRPDGELRWVHVRSYPVRNAQNQVDRLVGVCEDITDRKQSELSLRRTNQLLSAISQAQTQFIANADPASLFDNLLETLLQLTDSEYGFIGEILYHPNGHPYVDESYLKRRGEPYLKTKAITDIAWNEAMHQLHDIQAAPGMEFHNLRTLFGQVMVTGQPLISNHPSTDPRRGGLPEGHPPLQAFLGIPFYRGEQLVGMVGIANRPAGYTEALITELEPFLTTCASTIEAYRNDTRRQQVEVALRQSETLQTAIIQAIPDLLVRMDQNGHYHELIGTEYLNVLLPDQPIPEATVYDVLPAHLAEQRLHYARLALETNHLQVYEQTLEINGQLCHEEVRVVPLVDREVLIIIRDITERKRTDAERQQAETALRQSEERWQLAIEGSNDGIWDQDLITGKHFLSPRCLEMLGYTYAEIDSFEKWFAQVHPADRQALQTTLQAYLDRQTPIYAVEYRIRCKDGSYKWLLVRGKAVWDAAGTPLRLIGSTTDITLRRQAELELQQLNAELEQRVQQRTQALIQSERDLRTIFNNVYDAILIHDLDGTILDLNDRALELWEATREQLIGGSVPEISAPDAPLERLPEIFQRVQAGETLRFEWRDRRLSNNSLFDVEVSLRKVTLNNRPVFMAGVRDISERKRAEQILQQQLAAIEASSEGIAIVNPQGQYTYLNHAHIQLFGYSQAGELLGKTWKELYQPAEIAWIEQTVFPVLIQQGAWHGETIAKRQDNSLFTEDLSLTLLPDGRLICVCRDIGYRKQAEEALHSERLRLQLALDAAQMGSWSCSLQTGRLIWSDRAQEIFGFIPGTFPGDRDTFLALIHPEDRDRVIQAAAHTFETGTAYNIEYRIRRLDGEMRWIAVWGIVPLNLPVNERQLIGVVCDITDRKQAEQDLQESRNMLELVLDTIPQRVFWKDRQSRFLGCNSAFANDYALTFEEIVGKTDRELPWAEWAPLYQADDARVINTQTSKLNYEEPTVDLNGEQIWIRSSKIPLTNSQAEVIGVLGCYDDITDHKRAEEELQEAVATNQALLNAIPDLIVRISRDGIYRDGIPTNQLSLLLPRNELIGKSLWEVLPDTLAQQRLNSIEQAFQTGVPQIHEYQLYINGEWRYEEARCVVCRDDEAMVLIRDITDRKQAEAELHQLNLELEQRVVERTLELQQAMEVAEAANRAKSTFLANMSHELRTPLNAILGFAQLMARDLTMDPEKREQLSIINRSGQHLLHLINDILEMSKIEAGRITFVPHSFDLLTMLNMLEDMFQIRAIEKGLTFIVARDPSLPRYIATDENKLRQVLINLVGNAIKFTASGQVALRISRQAAEPSSSITLAASVCEVLADLTLQFIVADTGVGIDPDELNRLFEPFIQSSHRQGSPEGTGLGLPISRQFVQLMGGDLRVNSTPGVGSTFTVTIPVQLADATTGAISLPRHIVGLAPNQPSYRLLVVEDHDTNRLLLMQLLQAIGFEVQSANNGQEAIALWQTWQPHLIWMDMRMPIMDGYEATQQIRMMEAQRRIGEPGREAPHSSSPPATAPLALPLSSPTKIIALTASAFEDDRARVIEVGCDDFVRKPFQETELLEKIADHLGVQYLDAKADGLTNVTIPTDSFDPIAALQALPSRLLTQLYQATIQLDGQQLAKLTEQLASTHPSLAALLTTKLDNFDFEQILQLLQAVKLQE
ncbi:PAS domain S-box protein [Pantanalinema sp. GBBB05]|uniref:PAS domain S-box protein n=1 Tax=Pantanalinema sp. GBBB05 TaxID=2604139 RepID=UPI001D89C464|nr:PAS domain S-box protein [Pantanalinema sp. GBBB05]